MSTMLGMAPRPSRKRPGKAVLLLLSVLVTVLAATIWFLFQLRNFEPVLPFDGRKHVLVYQGEVFPQSYREENGEILVPFEFIRKHVDPNVFWDEPTKSVIITTKDKVVQLHSEKLAGFLNKKPIELKVPVQEKDGNRYIPWEPLAKLYPVHYQLHKETTVVTVEKAGYAVQQGKVLSADDQAAEPQKLRVGPSENEPFLRELSPDTQVDILGEKDMWYHVQTTDGIMGYLPKQGVQLWKVRHTAVTDTPYKPQTVAWKPLGKKINLVWEHVPNKNPNIDQIPVMPGVNVVSPTWFELSDDKGNLSNKANVAYSRWAHSRGYQVWGLVSNGFNPDWTKAMLGDFRLREKVIVQILQYANLYELDGINLDFENVYLDDKERLVQFVRELTPYLHEQGLTVSMDVTVKSSSDRWSRFYDRKALAQVVDYIAVMTYDEFWASSPVAGSVASLPWTEKGLHSVLEEVPSDKLLLGVPFYTRLWKEEKQADGTMKVTSKALSMSNAKRWLEERKVTPQLDAASGQMFASYRDPVDGAVYKIWLEDVTSMQKRISLVRKYDLAGVAAWKRGLEQPQIWTIIEEGLNRK